MVLAYSNISLTAEPNIRYLLFGPHVIRKGGGGGFLFIVRSQKCYCTPLCSLGQIIWAAQQFGAPEIGGKRTIQNEMKKSCKQTSLAFDVLLVWGHN